MMTATSQDHHNPINYTFNVEEPSSVTSNSSFDSVNWPLSMFKYRHRQPWNNTPCQCWYVMQSTQHLFHWAGMCNDDTMELYLGVSSSNLNSDTGYPDQRSSWWPIADVSHSIPNQLDFLGLFWWHILKQNWKAMAIGHLLVSAHSE
jgi:hypothetical protein